MSDTDLKVPYFEYEHGPSSKWMKRVKDLFDPKGIMNPGKKFKYSRSRPARKGKAKGPVKKSKNKKAPKKKTLSRKAKRKAPRRRPKKKASKRKRRGRR